MLPGDAFAREPFDSAESVTNNAINQAARLLYGSKAQVYQGTSAAFDEAFPSLDFYVVADTSLYPPILHGMAYDPSPTAIRHAYDITTEFNLLLAVANAVVTTPPAALKFGKAYAAVADLEYVPWREIVGPADAPRVGMTVDAPVAYDHTSYLEAFSHTYTTENGVVTQWIVRFELSRVKTAQLHVLATGSGESTPDFEAPNLRATMRILNTYGSSYSATASMWDGAQSVSLLLPSEVLSGTYETGATSTNFDGSTWAASRMQPGDPAFAQAAANSGSLAYLRQVAKNIQNGPCANQVNAQANLGLVSNDTDCNLEIRIFPTNALLCGVCVAGGNETRVYLSEDVVAYLRDDVKWQSRDDLETLLPGLLARAHLAYLDHYADEPFGPRNSPQALPEGVGAIQLASLIAAEAIGGKGALARMGEARAQRYLEAVDDLIEFATQSTLRGEPFSFYAEERLNEFVEHVNGGPELGEGLTVDNLTHDFDFSLTLEASRDAVWSSLAQAGGLLPPTTSGTVLPEWCPPPTMHPAGALLLPAVLLDELGGAQFRAFSDPIGTSDEIQQILSPYQTNNWNDIPMTVICAILALGLVLGLPLAGVAAAVAVVGLVALIVLAVAAPAILGIWMTLGFGQKDSQHDGYGDVWARQVQDHANHIVQIATDPDADDLTNIDEFRWLTLPLYDIVPGSGIVLFPNGRDFDGDAWGDAQEVAYWNNPANDELVSSSVWTQQGFAFFDPDWGVDIDGDGLNTTWDNDTDWDGLKDGHEYLIHLTFPDTYDSDCAAVDTACPSALDFPTTHDRANDPRLPGTGDDIGDNEERAEWDAVSSLLRIAPGTAQWLDWDGDGAASNLVDPDSDGDRVLDGEEFHGTTWAWSWDTDRDGLLDGDDQIVTAGDSRFEKFQNHIVSRRIDDTHWVFLGERNATHPTDPANPDSDSDGMADGWEALYGFDPTDPADATHDVDLDDLTNLQEYAYEAGDWDNSRDGAFWEGTNPRAWDTEGTGLWRHQAPDGLPDGWEADYRTSGLDPRTHTSRDTDGDALGPLQEYEWARPTGWKEATDGVWRGGTFPSLRDSDSDSLSDDWETRPGYLMDPRDPTDAGSDPDQDGLTNLQERAEGGHPRDSDTDNDGIRDGDELLIRTDPANPSRHTSVGDANSDAQQGANIGHLDHMPDGWEWHYRSLAGSSVLNPLDPLDGEQDPDGDTYQGPFCVVNVGVFDSNHEYNYRSARGAVIGDWPGTDPGHPDTDRDGMPDGYEACMRFDALFAPDGTDDGDADGLTNLQEYQRNTNPRDPDTDRDGLCDGSGGLNCTRPGSALRFTHGEAAYGTSPTNADTDGDGWGDGTEAVHWDPDDTGTVPNSDGAEGDNLHDADSDDDGLTDWEDAGWDPGAAATRDFDGDGLTDGEEVVGWTVVIDGASYSVTSNPTLRDSDGDGLEDQDEKTRGTRPNASDSDGDGVADGGEVDGWQITVDGTTRVVTSDPTRYHTDDDTLGDGVEFEFTDPRSIDTDADGVRDNFEDENGDGAVAEDESDPRLSDTDGDGLPDGAELDHGTDLLSSDTDDDSLTDADEVLEFGTDPRDPDTDDDYIADAEEIETGTLPMGNQDYDADGLLDGEEAYFYGTDPKRADSDCDDVPDGIDDNPYGSNIPPGTTPPDQSACAALQVEPGGTQTSGTFLLSELLEGIELQGVFGRTVTLGKLAEPVQPNHPQPDSEGVIRPASEDVALFAANEDGTISIFARPPPSATPISVVEVLIHFRGMIRILDGETSEEAIGRSLVRAELLASTEPADTDRDATDAEEMREYSENAGSPYTHGVRVGLPEGMTYADSLFFALTFADENLNWATYTGNVSLGDHPMGELEYADDEAARSTHNGADETGDNDWTSARSARPVQNGARQTGMIADGGFTLWRVIQRPETRLGGVATANGLSLGDPVALQSPPSNFAIYTNSSVPVDPRDIPLYTTQGWFGLPAFSVAPVTQAVSRAWEQSVPALLQATQQVAGVGGNAVASLALAVYESANTPEEAAATTLRVGADIVGVGDVIDIAEGISSGDNTQVAFGVAGLALSVATVFTGGAAAPVDGALTASKVAWKATRAAKAAGRSADAAEEAAKLAARNSETFGRAANAARQSGLDEWGAIAKIERSGEAVATAAKSEVGLRGLAVFTRESATAFQHAASRALKQTKLEFEFVGREAVRGGDEAARALVRLDGQLPVTDLAKATKKMPGHPDFATWARTITDRGTEGVDSIAKSAQGLSAKGMGRQAEGHAFHLRHVERWQLEGKVIAKLDHAEKVTITKRVRQSDGSIAEETFETSWRPDVLRQDADGKSFWDAKAYTKLRKGDIKEQVDKAEASRLLHVDEVGADRFKGAGIIVKDGTHVTEGAKKYAGDHGQPIISEAGELLNGAYYSGAVFW